MQFIVFIAALVALTQFHRYEHLRFIEELRALQKRLATPTPDRKTLDEQLKTDDWRVAGIDRTRLQMRRAFNVPTKWDRARYAVPLAFFCLLVFVLEAWVLAGIYAAVMAVKWFGTVTVLDLDPFLPRYEVRLFKLKLFGEPLGQEKK